ncbi:Growth hormone-regulated TBC protein 1, partial [Ananas comosus]
MFGAQTHRELSHEFTPTLRRRRTLWNSPAAASASASAAAAAAAAAAAITAAKRSNSNVLLSVKFEDLYGFTVEGNVDDVNVLNEVSERIRQQGRVWWALEASKGANWYLQPRISSNSEGISVASLKLSVLANSITLKRLIRKGIPPVLRPKVWLSVSGAAKKRSTVPETYYDELIRATEGSAPDFSESPMVGQRGGSGVSSTSTRRIFFSRLRSWILPGAKVFLIIRDSYTDGSADDNSLAQGLNYVAALLLLVMKTEEDAFWMLAVLLENVLVNDCYTDNLSGCHVEQRVFKDLLAKKCPRIAAHLEGLEFDVSLVATEWFLCLFSKSLPSETTLRVWDVLFNEGAKVLFHMREEDLLRTHHIGDVIDILQTTTHHLYDPDELLTVAFDKIGSMTTNTITKERKKQEPAVMAELDQRLRRLNSI